MSNNYNYSVSNDFEGDVNPGQLFLEVEKNGSITKKIHDTQISGDTVTLSFHNALSTAEQTELDNVISNHIVRTFNDTIPFLFQPIISRSKSYKSVLSFFYDGTKNGSNLDSLKIVSKDNSSGSGYYIRLFNSTNNKILFENLYTNKNYVTNILNNFSNIPEEESLIEIQIKTVKSNKSCYIKACKLIFD